MKKTSLDWAVPAEEGGGGEQCFDGPEAAIIGFTHFNIKYNFALVTQILQSVKRKNLKK